MLVSLKFSNLFVILLTVLSEFLIDFCTVQSNESKIVAAFDLSYATELFDLSKSYNKYAI